jgi:hypothetical protein
MSDSLFGHRDAESTGMELDKCTENVCEEVWMRNNEENVVVMVLICT